jgi:hypothetical protein
MYRIGRDHRGTTLVCLACPYTVRVQDFNEGTGNPRTLAAQAMLKHVHAEHSRETHVRATAMAVNGKTSLDSLAAAISKKISVQRSGSPGPLFRKD